MQRVGRLSFLSIASFFLSGTLHLHLGCPTPGCRKREGFRRGQWPLPFPCRLLLWGLSFTFFVFFSFRVVQ